MIRQCFQIRNGSGSRIAVLRIRNLIGSGFNQVSGSASRGLLLYLERPLRREAKLIRILKEKKFPAVNFPQFLVIKSLDPD
jgi:hypothetical protein